MDISNLNEILAESKSISDIARSIFGKENYTNREKCKKILEENGIDWKKWSEEKKIKPKKYCLYCGKEIVRKDARKKFCNSSCAASYNNTHAAKGERKKQHKCLNCGKEFDSSRNSKGKYCSISCQMKHIHNQYIEDWKNGKVDGMSGPSGISRHLKTYLFEKYNNKCQICGWGEKNPHTNNIPLQIHHIDGDCTNNKEENLQLLCPNCHSLTETFGSTGGHESKRVDRRTKYYRDEVESDKNKKIEEVTRCIICGKPLESYQTTFCSQKCAKRQYVKNITKEQIMDVFSSGEKVSYALASKILGISHTCLIRKCEKFGIKSIIQRIRFGDNFEGIA